MKKTDRLQREMNRQARNKLIAQLVSYGSIPQGEAARRLTCDGFRKLRGKGAFEATDVRRLRKGEAFEEMRLAVATDAYMNEDRVRKGLRPLTREEWAQIDACPLPPFRIDDLTEETARLLAAARGPLADPWTPSYDLLPVAEVFDPSSVPYKSSSGSIAEPTDRQRLRCAQGDAAARQLFNERLGQAIGCREYHIDRLEGSFSLWATMAAEYAPGLDSYAMGKVFAELRKVDPRQRLTPGDLAASVAQQLSITASIKHLKDRKDTKGAFEAYEAKTKVLHTPDTLRRGHHYFVAKRMGLAMEPKIEDGRAMVDGLVTAGAVEACVVGGKASLQPTPALLRFIDAYDARHCNARPLHWPMVVRPKDWTGQLEGGYLFIDGEMVHRATHEQVEYLKRDRPPRVFEAINALQATPFRINQGVLAVLAAEAERTPRLTSQVRIARRFKDEPEIFFTWYLDFRGRMYPVQHPLNPQADDAAKGLLEFAQGVQLGQAGVTALAVHGANCFGEDKLAEDDRVKWVDAHREDIIGSAENPRENRFWRDADEPYAFLAFCLEWEAAHRPGVAPEAYVSHLPCAYDCSCNAYQHLAALDRDAGLLAKTMPVAPDATPRDLYSAVALAMRKAIDLDAQTNATALAANHVLQGLDDKALRKIVKPGVMTTPYGAVGYSIGKKTRDKMKDAGVRNVSKPVLHYIVKKLVEAIGIAAPSAMRRMKEIREQATDYGAVGGKKVGKPVIEWITPAGFKVVQDYAERIEAGKVSKGKPVTASVPNKVHSLDASHMMSTIGNCLTAGITSFAMVHDSYATHAANLKKMERILWASFNVQYWTETMTIRIDPEAEALPSVMELMKKRLGLT